MRGLGPVSLVFLLGCGGSEWKTGPGDARLTADALAWPCDFGGDRWVGTQHFFIDLQHAPGLVETRPLPQPGSCEVWGSTFAKDDLLAGSDLTDVDGFMEWSLLNGGNDERVSEGTFQPLGTGYWHSDAYDDFQTCYDIGSVMMDGVEVRNGPSLKGVSTPIPGALISVELDINILEGVQYGTEFTASWETEGWQDQFVLLNRSRAGWTVESIVCNIAGQTTFTVDDQFWALSNPATGSDASRFFLGFRNIDKQVSETGLKVETLSRGLWSVTIIE